MTPETRISELGLHLPAPVQLPPGVPLPFAKVNLRGNRALVSGHPRHGADGKLTGPYGQVGADLTLEEARAAAAEIALCVLANLKQEIGALSRISGWCRVFGMVNSAPGFSQQHLVMNGFSDTILQIFGPDIGRHARSAIGTAGLPMNFAIEVEAEVLLD